MGDGARSKNAFARAGFFENAWRVRLGLLAVIGYFVLRGLAGARLPLLPDEAYYWTWASAPAWSYFDHPPGIAWALAGARALFGDARLAPRSLAFVSALGLMLFAFAATARLAEHRGQDVHRAVQQSFLLLVGAPMFSWGFLVATPDVLLGGVLGCALWGTVHALGPNPSRLGFVTALAFTALALCKHAGGVLALGVLAGAVSSARGRRALCRRGTLFGLVIGCGWVLMWTGHDLHAGGSYHFQWHRVHAGDIRVLSALPLVLGAVALTGSPVGLFALGRGLRAGFGSDASPAERALSVGSMTLLALCIYAALVGSGEFHWVFPSFLAMVPVMGVRLAGSGGWLRGANLACALLGALSLGHIVTPWMAYHPRPDRDPSLRGAGYEEIVRHVAREATARGARAILTRRYQLASLVRYHLKDRLNVVELGVDRPSQFDRWEPVALCPGDWVVALVGADQDLGGIRLREESVGIESLIRRQGSTELGRLKMISGQLLDASDSSSPSPCRDR